MSTVFDVGEIQATLTLDRTAFTAALDEAKSDVEDFEKTAASATLTVDDAQALAAIDALQAQLDALSGTSIDVDVVDEAADAALDDLTERIARITNEVTITVMGDVLPAEADLDALQAQVTKLSDDAASITVTADTFEVTDEIVDLEGKLAQLRTDVTDIPVTADTTQAVLALQDIQDYYDDLKSDVANLTVTVGDTEAMAALADLKAQLDDIGTAVIDPSIGSESIDKAALDLQAFKTDLDALKAENVNIGISLDTAAADAKLAEFVAAEKAAQDAGNDSGGGGGFSGLIESMGSADSWAGRLALDLAALGPVIAGVAAAAGGALTALPALFAGLASGAGALVLGFHGVITAIEDTVAAQGQSSSAAGSNAASMSSSASTIVSAQQSVASAVAAAAQQQITAAESVQSANQTLANAIATQSYDQTTEQQSLATAEQAVATARASAAASIVTAEQGVTTAQNTLTEAQYSAQQAQEALTSAQQSAADNMQNLTDQVADGALAQQQATINVQTALAALQAAQAAPGTTTALAMQQLQLTYAQAVQQVTDLGVAQTQLVQQQQAAATAGVNGAQSVVQANNAVSQAVQAVGTAQAGVKSAQAGVTTAQTAGAASVAAALQSLANTQASNTRQSQQDSQAVGNAQTALANLAESNAYSQKTAAQSVTTAQEALAAAVAGTGSSYTTAATPASTLATALAGLTPAGKTFVSFVTADLLPAFTQLEDKTQAILLPDVTTALKGMGPAFGVISASVTTAAKGIGDFLVDLSKIADSTQGVADLNAIWQDGDKFMSELGSATLSFLQAVLNLGGPGGTILDDIGASIERAATAFEGWSASSEASEFFAYVDQVGPEVAKTVGDIGSAIGQLLIGAAALAPYVLDIIDDFAKFISIPIVGNISGVALALAGMGIVLVKLAGYANTVVTGFGKLQTAFYGIGATQAASSLSGVGTATEGIGKNATEAAVGIGAVGTAEAGVTAESGLLSAALDVAFGPVGLVLAGVTALGGLALWLNNVSKAATQAGQAFASDFDNQITSATTSINAQEQALQSEINALDAQNGQLQGVTGTLINASAQYSTIGTLIAGVTDFFSGNTSQVDANDASVKALQSDLDKLQASQTANSTAAQASTAAQQALGEHLNATAAQTLTLSGAESSLKTQLDTVKTSVTNVTNALNGLIGSNLTADQDAIQFKQTLAQLSTSFQTNGTDISLASTAGANNRSVLDQLSQQILATVDSQTKQHLSTQTIIADMNNQINQVLAVGKQYGVSTTDIEAYLKQIGLTPAQVTTTLNQEGYTGAITNVTNLNDLINDLKSKSITISTNYITNGQLSQLQQAVAGDASNILTQPGLAGGGHIPGYSPGHDTVPAMLSPGEFVLRPEAVAAIGVGNLHAMNAAPFAAGGLVGLNFSTGEDPSDSILSSIAANTVTAANNAAALAANILAAGTSTSGITNGVLGAVAPGSTQAIGEALAASRGWSGPEWSALDQLWNIESGWNTFAQNPNSPAYGIPQADPGDKMAAVGADWLTNPTTQITWGLDYIASTYGDPITALSQELTNSVKGWPYGVPGAYGYELGGLVGVPQFPKVYDSGGLIPPGGLAINNSSSPEPVLTSAQWNALAGAAGASSQPINQSFTLQLGDDEFTASVSSVADKRITASQRRQLVLRRSGVGKAHR